MTGGKLRSRASLALAASAALLLLGSCIYFNTMYNARRIFSEAEEMRSEADGRSGRRSAGDKYEQVVIKCAKIIRDHPESSWVDDAIFLMGKALVRQGELSNGIRKFQELQANYPESEYVPRAYYWLALANMEKREYTQALVFVDQFLEKYPDHEIRSRVLFLGGDINIELDNDQEALRYYLMAEESSDDGDVKEEAVLKQAELYYRFEEWEKAAASYESLIHKGISWDNRYKYSLRLGECFVRTGRCQEALDLYSEVLPQVTRLQDQGPVMLGQAAGYACMDSLATAIKVYENITGKFPRSTFASEAYYRLGVIYHEKLDSLQLAQNAFEKAGQESSSSEFAPIASQKASSIKRLLDLQKDEGAGGSTERLAEKKFMSAEIQYTRLGETERAVSNYQAVVDSFPDSRYAPMAAYAMGFIYSREFGDSTRAKDMWRELIRKYPRSAQARGAITRLESAGMEDLVYGLQTYIDSALADTTGAAEELRRRREIAVEDSLRLAAAQQDDGRRAPRPEVPRGTRPPGPAAAKPGTAAGMMGSGRFTPGMIRLIRQRKFEDLRRRMWGTPGAPADSVSTGPGG